MSKLLQSDAFIGNVSNSIPSTLWSGGNGELKVRHDRATRIRARREKYTGKVAVSGLLLCNPPLRG